MPRRTVLKSLLSLAAGTAAMQAPRATAQPPGTRPDGGRWSAERANRWYQQQGWLVGANYVTSNAVNQLEMFQSDSYDPRRIDTELGWARSNGFNTVRVFLHDLLWAQDRRGFQARLAQFVDIAAARGIKPLFVLFDSCWDPFPQAGPQRAPRPGVHNSGWVQSPGATRLDDRGYARTLQGYVTGVLTQFRSDDRVLGWDLWNEPDNPSRYYRQVERPDKLDRVADLLPQVFAWARSVDPSQPLTSGVWDGEWADPGGRSAIAGIQLDNSDVITFHNYGDSSEFEGRITELAPQGRPILCTEYMARPLGSTVLDILPIAKRHNVGAFNWGLVVGKTQTFFPWDSWEHPYTAMPDVWFHDLLAPDGRPFQDAEVQIIRELSGLAMHLRDDGGPPPS
ncbi:glycoside hydrolase 5 family protein [Mycobacterium saskatchewanense]|uniref:1,4-beta-xylanase n=1 Tax=Mycobacterium saskatchewanense TaxID=220927 RepID=A0AAJ3TX89_9MYCO|nr:cellulase family glycosylhydrolase [Mycobacterium saskatchewanense]ORW71902.1 1,4-beta-xylanase [Mycobacterium saskatchewanense]